MSNAKAPSSIEAAERAAGRMGSSEGDLKVYTIYPAIEEVWELGRRQAFGPLFRRHL